MMAPNFRPGDNFWFSFLTASPLYTLYTAKRDDLNMSFSPCSLPNSLLCSLCSFLPPHSFSCCFFTNEFHLLPLVLISFSASQPSCRCLLYSCTRMLSCHEHNLSTVIQCKFSCPCKVYVTLEKLLNFCKGQLPHL